MCLCLYGHLMFVPAYGVCAGVQELDMGSLHTIRCVYVSNDSFCVVGHVVTCFPIQSLLMLTFHLTRYMITVSLFYVLRVNLD